MTWRTMISRTVGPSAEEQLESWQKRWTRANAERDQALDELAVTRERLAGVGAQLETATTRITDLEKTITKREQALEKIAAHASALEKKLANSRQEVSA